MERLGYGRVLYFAACKLELLTFAQAMKAACFNFLESTCAQPENFDANAFNICAAMEPHSAQEYETLSGRLKGCLHVGKAYYNKTYRYKRSKTKDVGIFRKECG